MNLNLPTLLLSEEKNAPLFRSSAAQPDVTISPKMKFYQSSFFWIIIISVMVVVTKVYRYGLTLDFPQVQVYFELLSQTKNNTVFQIFTNSSETHRTTKTCEERIIDRARSWLGVVTYEYYQFHNGYRTQCSGFVAAAWNLTVTNPQETPRCFDFEPRGLATVIDKDELKMGDAMVCNKKKIAPYLKEGELKRQVGQQAGGHCLIFEKWANKNRSAYIGWELCKDANCRDVTRREIPYPYFYKTRCFEPMRYTTLNETCA